MNTISNKITRPLVIILFALLCSPSALRSQEEEGQERPLKRRKVQALVQAQAAVFDRILRQSFEDIIRGFWPMVLFPDERSTDGEIVGNEPTAIPHEIVFKIAALTIQQHLP